MNDTDIINYFTCCKSKRVLKCKLNNLTEDNEIKKYLFNRFKDFISYEESLYRIIHKIEIKDKCPICNKPVFLFSFKYGYLKTCENKNCIKKYKGINSSFNKEETQDKCKETILNKYGVSNPYNILNIKQKCIANTHSVSAIEKRKQTCIEKYGCENVGGSEHSIKIIKEKWNNKNNDDKKEIEEKRKNTCLQKYNKEYYQSTDEFKEHISNVMHDKNTLQKRYNTLLNKYGIKNFNNQNKRISTLIKNGTINSSKTEDQSFILLKQKYSDTIHQYKDKERYPFTCDFYIPSLDLFIECQYGQFHNFKPYLNTKEDKKEIELLKQKSERRKQITGKNKSRYDAVIYTWSDLDVRKRNIAKQNNLNYIEFWNINELKEWLNQNN